MHNKNLLQSSCVDNVGVNVNGLNKDNMPRCGDVIAIDDLKVDPHPPRQAGQFTSLVFVKDHPGKLNRARLEKQKQKCKGGKGASSSDDHEVYKGGFSPSFVIRTAFAPCIMV
eukprot:984727_1